MSDPTQFQEQIEGLSAILREVTQCCEGENQLDRSIAQIQAQDGLPAKVKRTLITELEKQRAPMRTGQVLSVLRAFGEVLRTEFRIEAKFRSLTRVRRKATGQGKISSSSPKDNPLPARGGNGAGSLLQSEEGESIE